MKVTSQVVESKPKLKSISIELTPRQAFLLGIVIGNFNVQRLVDHSNNGGYLDNPPWSSCNDNVKGEMTLKEAQNLQKIYHLVKEQLNNQYEI